MFWVFISRNSSPQSSSLWILSFRYIRKSVSRRFLVVLIYVVCMHVGVPGRRGKKVKERVDMLDDDTHTLTHTTLEGGDPRYSSFSSSINYEPGPYPDSTIRTWTARYTVAPGSNAAPPEEMLQLTHKITEAIHSYAADNPDYCAYWKSLWKFVTAFNCQRIRNWCDNKTLQTNETTAPHRKLSCSRPLHSSWCLNKETLNSSQLLLSGFSSSSLMSHCEPIPPLLIQSCDTQRSKVWKRLGLKVFNNFLHCSILEGVCTLKMSSSKR